MTEHETTMNGGNAALPDGWVWATLKAITEKIDYGLTEKAQQNAVGPKFLRITDLQEGRVNWETVPYCYCSEDDFQKYKLLPNDLVFARTGATTGKSYLVLQCPDAVFASYLIRLRVFDGVNPKYLSYFFQSGDYWAQITTLRKGSAQPGVNAAVLASVSFPLAPLNEQRRIVEAIETQFTRLDAGVDALKRLRKSLKRYKAAVLKAACEGQLVPQDASDEPASELLARILRERRAKWAADQRAKGKDPRKLTYPEPAAPDTSDLPELPEGWVWATFDQLLQQLKNGYFAGAPVSEPPGIPILRIGAVRPLLVDLSSVKYIRDESERMADYILNEGDLLFTRYNGSVDYVGVAGIVRGLKEKVLYPDKLIRAILVSEDILSRYIEYYFATSLPRSIIEDNVVSSAGQNGISGPTLKAIPVALPPTREQYRIVDEIERFLSVAIGLEEIINDSLTRAERLRQSILKEAFAGRLVPQDPDDEPASELLAHIRRERTGGRAARGRHAKG